MYRRENFDEVQKAEASIEFLCNKTLIEATTDMDTVYIELNTYVPI